MKTRWMCVLVLLVLQLLLSRAATAQPPPPLTPDQARQAALARLQIQVAAGHALAWRDATLQDPITLYDLSGTISAYLFPVRRGDESAGYLTVAAADIPNPVLEFAAEGPHPLSDLSLLVNHDLQDQRSLYLGLLSYGYELAPTTEGRRVLDLASGSIVKVNPAQATIPLISTLPPSSDDDASSLLAYKLISGVPDWNQFWGSYGCYSGCSPTSGANVMGYWDSHGYGNLIGSNWQAAVNEMRTHMDTFCHDGQGGTYIDNISPGMVSYAQAHGYYFVADTWSSDATYANYRTQIDANQPLVVDVMGHSTYGDHSVAGVGYDSNGTYMIVHDNWPSTGENVYLKYGSGYGSIYMHPVVPDATPPIATVVLAGTAGENGWYLSDIRVTLTASDGDGSGVKTIKYQIDDSDWHTHNGASVSFTVSGEGAHVVRYQAQDQAGNWSAEKNAAANIDTTAPTAAPLIAGGAGTVYAVSVLVEPRAQDASSGPAFTYLSHDGQSWHGEPYVARTTWTLELLNRQWHTVYLQVEDKAGNISARYTGQVCLDLYPAHPSAARLSTALMA